MWVFAQRTRVVVRTNYKENPMFKHLKATVGTKINKFALKHNRKTLLGISAEGYYVVFMGRHNTLGFLDPKTFELVEI